MPAFAFGQSRCFGFYKPKVRGWAADVLSRWAGCAPILFWGRLGSPIPYPVPLRIFVGDPIPTRRCTEPSDAEVAALLGQFVAAMQELFEKHKAEAGYPDLKLCVL